MKCKELSVEQTIKTMENWKSWVSIRYFGVPGPGSHFGGPGSRVPLEYFKVPVLGLTLGVPVPLENFEVPGPRVLFVNVTGPGSHFFVMPLVKPLQNTMI